MKKLSDEEKWQAVVNNDRNYDGVFYYGVKTTGIVCRPSCPSKVPARKNVVFFDDYASALQAGFRPCKRCRPDLLNYDPAKELAAQLKDTIDTFYGERTRLQEEMNQIGMTRGHLRELFEASYDKSPEEYLAAVRLARAEELLRNGTSITETAMTVGFSSPSAFTTFWKAQTGMTPSQYLQQEKPQETSCLYESPIGLIRIRATEKGICSLKFIEHADQTAGEKKGLLEDTCSMLDEYFAGKRQHFEVPLDVEGSVFQKKVWKDLREIPYGSTRSYQQIAESIGREKAARPVGMACNRNPILILIPCHRVVGSNGSLVGYAGGIERKQYLLNLEQKNA